MCKLLLSRGASPGPAPWHPPGAGQDTTMRGSGIASKFREFATN